VTFWHCLWEIAQESLAPFFQTFKQMEM
jgi:hypothetical protein